MKTDLKAFESPYPLRRKFNVFIVPLLILLTVLIAGVMSAGSTRIIKSIYLEVSQNRAEIIARALQEVNEEVWRDLQQTRAPQALFETPQGQALLKTLRGEVKELGLSHLKIYGKGGLLLYSSEEEEIGQFDPSLAYQKAATGQRSLVEKQLPDGPKLYELYVPVSGSSHAVVMELYEPVDYLNALVWQIVIPATLVPVLVLILLGVGMRKVVGRAQADIDYRTDLLSDFRERLEKLVSLEAVQSLRSSAGKGRVDSRRINATILFSDVRGFTEFCEKETPETVVSFLNQSLGAVIDAVRDQQGDVDKMIGDAVLAHFQGPDAQARALAAAQRAQAQLKILGLPKGVGIGIFTGEVVVGTVGAANRMDFTVIGDTVNVASRLCSCAAEGEIVMDVASASQAGINLHSDEEEVSVKGRDRSLRIVRIRE